MSAEIYLILTTLILTFYPNSTYFPVLIKHVFLDIFRVNGMYEEWFNNETTEIYLKAQ